ncbi:MAG: hypothetical protein M3Q30_22470 [Actinomycetota bacterium]|nr:hypothetical protein [Actinomycetota bacterium]
MTAAEDAAKDVRRAQRRARPFRIASLVLFVVVLGSRTGLITIFAIVVLVPLAIWAAVAADRYRYTRNLPKGVVARTGAVMRSARGRRWIGVLSVEQGGVRWTPSKRFRKRGAEDVVVPWEAVAATTAARASASWASWMARCDALAFEQTDGSRVVFSVTSPQVIYRALAESGHSPPVPD